MDSNPFTPATGSIGSRFESQNSIDEARETREKEWKEAYARIGQEPPPQAPDEEYDPRTLYERLQTKKDAKKEEWDSKMKLSNQWRGLDTEEQRFLAEKEAEKRAEQRKLEDKEAEEIREYREQLAAKHAATPLEPPTSIASSSSKPPSSSTSASASSIAKKPLLNKPVRKDVKSLMKGLVVKKKAKPASPSAAIASPTPATPSAKPSPVSTPRNGIASPSTAQKDASNADAPKVQIGTKRDAPEPEFSTTSDPLSEQTPIPPVDGESEEKRRKV